MTISARASYHISHLTSSAISFPLYLRHYPRQSFPHLSEHIMIYLSTDRSSSSSPAVVRGCAEDLPYRADPTQETYATVDNHADDTAPTRQHELDHTRSGIYPISALDDLDHELWE